MRMWIGSILLGSALASVANAQENLASIELLGRAGLYSANFERYFTRRFGLGAGFATLGFSGQNAFIIPLYFSANPIGNKNSLYLGAGATITTSNVSWFGGTRDYGISALGLASVGYQYRTAGGLVIRPTVNMFFQRDGFVPWPGLTIGRSF